MENIEAECEEFGTSVREKFQELSDADACIEAAFRAECNNIRNDFSASVNELRNELAQEAGKGGAMNDELERRLEKPIHDAKLWAREAEARANDAAKEVSSVRLHADAEF